MAGDPYEALGLAKSASDADIKKAYRRIAKADHPDLNPDPAATARFKAASSAYDLLKDPEQRRRFDAGEIDAQGQDDPLAVAGARVLESLSAVPAGYRIPERDTVHALRMLRSLTHGFAVLEVAGGFQMATDVDDSFEWTVDFVDRGLRSLGRG